MIWVFVYLILILSFEGVFDGRNVFILSNRIEVLGVKLKKMNQNKWIEEYKQKLQEKL